MPVKMLRKHRLGLALLYCVLISGLLTGCPPTARCDEKIKDPKVYENAIRSNPVIQELNSTLTQRNFTLGNCFVDGKVSTIIEYALPVSYSAYQVAYRDQISISYAKDGTILLNNPTSPPTTIQASAVLDYFKGRIQELESDPRVSEVIGKTEPDPMNPIVPLFGQEPVLRSDYNRVEYNFFYHLVRGYILSNDIEWQEYPEIQLAHQVMEQHLLVGDLANCSIGKGEIHAYTQAQFHDSADAPWNMTVALQCDDGWKDAFVQLKNDGTYDKLSILTNYYNK